MFTLLYILSAAAAPMDWVVVEGEADNLKITRPVDLLVARELLDASDG
jgi:2-C-methyl-D-erythritol 4-phosphate cytidylyltransferase